MSIPHKRPSASKTAFALFVASVFVSTPAFGQPPAGFHWIDFKREGSTVSKIERALKDEDYSAIREIGLTDTFALVLTVRREAGQTTFDGDEWRVYNLSTKSWNVQTLLMGFHLQVEDWIKFQATSEDLGLVYKDCWECEPATVFTALHYDPQKGWRTRWANAKDPNHPGLTMLITDVGDPYTNEDVDQVFSVVAPSRDIAMVGTWYYSKDLSTGKVSETVTKSWVNQSTGKEESAELSGTAAKTWKSMLCEAANSRYGLSQGQSSRACKNIKGVRGKTSP